jgi:hypothetical protein
MGKIFYLRSSDKRNFIDVKALLQILILTTDKLKANSYWFPAVDKLTGLGPIKIRNCSNCSNITKYKNVAMVTKPTLKLKILN